MNVRIPHAIPEARKRRLRREALGHDGGPMPSAESAGRIFGSVGLVLMAAVAFSSGLPEHRERMAIRATDPNVASATHSLPVTLPGTESGRTETEGNVQDLTY